MIIECIKIAASNYEILFFQDYLFKIYSISKDEEIKINTSYGIYQIALALLKLDNSD